MSAPETAALTLEDLVGPHLFGGAEHDAEERACGWCDDRTEQVGVFRFALDGVVYTAEEDPDDGYRSSLREIRRGGTLANRVPPTRVLARMLADEVEEHGYATQTAHRVLELIDIETGEIVVQVGTTNVDDYYPCYTAYFQPTALACNREGR